MFSSWTVHWYGLLGVIFILATIFMPDGLHGIMLGLRDRVLRRTPK